MSSQSARGLLDTFKKVLENGDLEKGARQHRLGSEFSAVATMLRGQEKELSQLAALVPIVDLAQEAPRDIIDRAVAIQSAANALESADSPERLKSWRKDDWQQVTNASTALRAVFQTRWDNRCATGFQDHLSLAGVLASVDSTKPLAARMRATATAALAMRGSLPSSAAKEKIEDLVGARDLERSELEAVGLTSDVQQFLRAIIENKATLNRLTDTTFAWLKQSGASKLFQLILRPDKSR